MSPTPEQAYLAMQNHKRLPRTHGTRVRDVLVHVKNSREDYVENRPVGDPACLLEYPYRRATTILWDGHDKG